MSEDSAADGTTGSEGGAPQHPWTRLTTDYERSRRRDDSLDSLVEWPAQRAMLGDVHGRSVLDLGCGDGGKLIELVREGAKDSVGVDVAGSFIGDRPVDVQLVTGDLSNLESIAPLQGRMFDRVLFLQSFGYASDPVATLKTVRTMLAADGFVVLTRTQPIRYALERAERNGTSLGEEYFTDAPTFEYASSWNHEISLTKRPYTMADLLNTFSAAGFWVESTVEPRLSVESGQRFPHKRDWLNKYLGILIFKLRPLPVGSKDHAG